MVVAEQERRKRGPVPGRGLGTGRVKTTMELDADLVEWGKMREPGLSELVRRLLREEKTRQEAARA